MQHHSRHAAAGGLPAAARRHGGQTSGAAAAHADEGQRNLFGLFQLRDGLHDLSQALRRPCAAGDDGTAPAAPALWRWTVNSALRIVPACDRNSCVRECTVCVSSRAAVSCSSDRGDAVALTASMTWWDPAMSCAPLGDGVGHAPDEGQRTATTTNVAAEGQAHIVQVQRPNGASALVGQGSRDVRCIRGEDGSQHGPVGVRHRGGAKEPPCRTSDCSSGGRHMSTTTGGGGPPD